MELKDACKIGIIYWKGLLVFGSEAEKIGLLFFKEFFYIFLPAKLIILMMETGTRDSNYTFETPNNKFWKNKLWTSTRIWRRKPLLRNLRKIYNGLPKPQDIWNVVTKAFNQIFTFLLLRYSGLIMNIHKKVFFVLKILHFLYYRRREAFFKEDVLKIFAKFRSVFFLPPGFQGI